MIKIFLFAMILVMGTTAAYAQISRKEMDAGSWTVAPEFAKSPMIGTYLHSIWDLTPDLLQIKVEAGQLVVKSKQDCKQRVLKQCLCIDATSCTCRAIAWYRWQEMAYLNINLESDQNYVDFNGRRYYRVGGVPTDRYSNWGINDNDKNYDNCPSGGA